MSSWLGHNIACTHYMQKRSVTCHGLSVANVPSTLHARRLSKKVQMYKSSHPRARQRERKGLEAAFKQLNPKVMVVAAAPRASP